MKKILSLVLALNLFTVPLAQPLAVLAYRNSDINLEDFLDELDYDVEFISELDFKEIQDSITILEEIHIDDYAMYVKYESIKENIENGYVEVGQRPIVVFKKVAISTWMAFENPEVTRRLGSVVSSSNMGQMTTQRTNIVRTALRNQSFMSEAALGQRVANELVRQAGMRQGNADAIGLGERNLVRWR